jgi:DNA polymerase I
VPQDRATGMAEVVRNGMQAAAALDVPLTVDIGIGGNWNEAKA